MEINGTYFSQADQAELANLYHLAKTALSGDKDGRWERMNWAAKAFSAANGGTEGSYPVIRCYKALDRTLA